MLTSSARLLQLLGLLQRRRTWSGAELAGELDITERTVRRDVDKLRALGYPVHASTGTAGGYRLGAGADVPPLLLDDDEAVAVAVGLRMAGLGTVAGLGEASFRALDKLERTLPARLRPAVSALQSATVPLGAAAPTVPADVLVEVAAACRDGVRLRFDYRDLAGAQSFRRVQPHRLVPTGTRWYLVAYDEDREQWRSFRVDRIAPPLTLGRRNDVTDPPDAATFVARGITTAPYPVRAVVDLHLPVEEAARLIPPTVGTLSALSEQTCRLELGAHSMDALVVHLGLLDCAFDVREPPELGDRARAVGRRLLGVGR